MISIKSATRLGAKGAYLPQNRRTQTLNDSFRLVRHLDDFIVTTHAPNEEGICQRYEQSRINWKTHRAQHAYTRSILDKINTAHPVKVLLLGGAGASIAHEAAHHMPNVDMTVVDISQDSLNIGQRLLGMKSRQIKWVHDDAKEYLQKVDNCFDVIICDIFDVIENVIPDFITTEDFINDVKTRLSPGGCYIQNIVGNRSAFLENLKFLGMYFNRVKIDTSGDPDAFEQNYVYMCQQL